MSSWFSMVAGHWTQALWVLSWQIATLSGIVWLISLFCRRLPSNFRYWLWCIVLARLCIPVHFSLPVGVTDNVRETAERYVQSVLSPTETRAKSVVYEDPSANTSVESPMNMRIAYVWLAIASAIALGVSGRVLQVRRALRACPLVTRPDLVRLLDELRTRCGIRTPVTLRRTARAMMGNGPAVIGVLHPTIILPSHMADHWAIADLEPAVLHELAHIRRGDLWVNLAQIAVQTVYFFHPLVWYVNWRIRQVREEVCDDLAVLHLGGERKRYGSSLLRVIEESNPDTDWALGHASMAEPKTSLGRRVVRIMSTNYRCHHRLSLRAVVSLTLVALGAICVAGGNTREQAAPTSPEKNAMAMEAEALYKAKEYSKAITLFEQLHAEYPDSNEAAHAMMMVGICLDWMGEKEKALDALEKAAAAYPDRKGWSETTYFYLGDAYRQMGRNEDALVAYRKCAELCKGVRKPEQFPYVDARGWIELTPAEALFESKRYEDAIKAYKKVAESYPSWNYAEHALMMVGLCYERMGSMGKAITAYRAAVSKYPDLRGWSETTWYYLGNACEQTGHVGEALRAYRQCVKLCGGAPARKPNSFPWRDAQQRITLLESSGK